MTDPDIAALAKGLAPLESLTKAERAWLRRRFCGWCERSALSRSCGAMYSKDDDRCDMDERRGEALKRYKPRPRLPQGER